MNAKVDKLIQIHSEFQSHMRKLCGRIWKEAYSEIHAQYKEIPVWILFFEDTDLSEAHKAFRDLVILFIPRIGEFQFTVAYKGYSDGSSITFDFLMSNEEILRGWSVRSPLGSEPSRSCEKSPLFQSQDSKRNT